MNGNWSAIARTGLASAVLTLGLIMGTAEPRAQTPQEIASMIPPSVSEVIVGGEWGGDDGGVYRAVLIYRETGDEPKSDVVLQWLTLVDDGPEVTHSEIVTSITGKSATTAFVAFDYGDRDDEPTRLLVGTYDPETDEDETQLVRLGAPGEFEFLPSTGQE